MRLPPYGVSFVLVLCRFVPCLAQQESGSATLKNSPERIVAAPPADADVATRVAPLQGTLVRPKNGVQHPDLDKGWASYDAAMAKAAKSIRAAIAKQFNSATTRGDLDTAVKWQAALVKLDSEGRLPTETEIKTFVAAVKKAKDELSKAYDAVVKDMTIEKKITEAQFARQEWIALDMAIEQPKPKGEKGPQVNPAAAQPLAPAIAGKWFVKYTTGVRRDYDFAANGQVVKMEAGATVRGTYQAEKDGFLVFVDGAKKLEFWQPNGEAFSVNHYVEAIKYPEQPAHITGVARRP